MKQVIQDLKTGTVTVEEVPAPQVGRGKILIRTRKTLISAGTERMLLEFGEANWINKARQQPDKVRQVIDKVKTDGLVPTYQAVMDKLDAPMPLGYCHVGTVIGVGADVTQFKIGDRVISNGNHCEVVACPVNLCAKIPDSVSDDEATFTVLTSIALQGVRLAEPTLGEFFVVTGLGLIGLLTAQLLKANGCFVLGLDFDESRLQMARAFGIEAYKPSDDAALLAKSLEFSRGRGVDGVLIAAATDSNAPLLQAAQMCRKKGRVVLIGVTGSQFSRTEFFKKEISFQVSCSYGPGRYDTDYEEKGIDYPVGYVRWTEGRNFEAVLDLMKSKALQIDPLISHRFDIQDAASAYEVILDGKSSLGVLLEYKNEPLVAQTIALPMHSEPTAKENPGRSMSVIGAGNHAVRTLIPALKEAGANLTTIVASRGLPAMYAAKKFGFASASTDLTKAYSPDAGESVVIATRHSQHAKMILEALKAHSRKNVFVEKPLVVNHSELNEVQKAFEGIATNERPILMVGYNRRFSPLTEKMVELLKPLSGPKVIQMTINAGSIPADHWTQALEEGRRLIGEGCHFIDLARFIADSEITESQVLAAEPTVGSGNAEDHFFVNLKFKNGSAASIAYFANGHKAYPKERIEVFCQGKVLAIDNFKSLKGYGFARFTKLGLWSQDKGQKNMAKKWVEAVKLGKASPIPWEQTLEVAKVCIDLALKLRSGQGRANA